MKNDEYFLGTQRLLSAEFSKYTLAHPEVDDQIPNGSALLAGALLGSLVAGMVAG